jgi:hypothetical protein
MSLPLIERLEEMIEDKATERWKERAKKLGLIVNMGVDKPKQETGTGRKAKTENSKASKKGEK